MLYNEEYSLVSQPRTTRATVSFRKERHFFMIITVLGHYVFEYREEYKKRLLDYLEKTVGDKPCTFYLGCFGGLDRFARLCCMEYRFTHPNVKLVHVVAYPDKIFNAFGYDDKFYPLAENVSPFIAVQHRNAWMAKHADIIITFTKRVCGVMKDILESASRENKTIVNLADQ